MAALVLSPAKRTHRWVSHGGETDRRQFRLGEGEEVWTDGLTGRIRAMADRLEEDEADDASKANTAWLPSISHAQISNQDAEWELTSLPKETIRKRQFSLTFLDVGPTQSGSASPG